jgi:hypothetical protein
MRQHPPQDWFWETYPPGDGPRRHPPKAVIAAWLIAVAGLAVGAWWIVTQVAYFWRAVS